MVAAMCALGGCATVSVIPGASQTQEIVSIEQSALRTSAAEFTKEATERYWIAEDRGFLRFARVLAHGNASVSAGETHQETYAEMIGVGQRNHASIALSLSADVNDASTLLASLSQSAQTFLTVDRSARSVTTRADLVSFERTLVQAQKVRRTFAHILPEIATTDTSSVDAAMAKFDRQVDRARQIADRLAREYTNRDVQAVS
jgi:hypothetical protein